MDVSGPQTQEAGELCHMCLGVKREMVAVLMRILQKCLFVSGFTHFLLSDLAVNEKHTRINLCEKNLSFKTCEISFKLSLQNDSVWSCTKAWNHPSGPCVTSDQLFYLFQIQFSHLHKKAQN